MDAWTGLKRVLELRPNAPEALYWFARCGQALAASSLDSFLERSQSTFRAQQLQGEYLAATGDQEGAVKEFRAALTGAPTSAQIHLAIGNIRMDQHRYAEAAAEYEEEIKLDPFSRLALERAGQAYALLHDTDRAEALLKRSYAMDPTAFETLRGLGRIASQRQDYTTAVRYFTLAVSRAPAGETGVLYQLSTAYRKLGNDAEAERWLKRLRTELAAANARAQEGLSVSTAATRAGEPSSP